MRPIYDHIKIAGVNIDKAVDWTVIYVFVGAEDIALT